MAEDKAILTPLHSVNASSEPHPVASFKSSALIGCRSDKYATKRGYLGKTIDIGIGGPTDEHLHPFTKNSLTPVSNLKTRLFSQPVRPQWEIVQTFSFVRLSTVHIKANEWL